MAMLNTPHGGTLKNLYLETDQCASIKLTANKYPGWVLSPQQLNIVELLLNGALSPLEGFMCEKDYRSVTQHYQLTDGTYWPMPIALGVTENFVSQIKNKDSIALRSGEGILIAVMNIEDCWPTAQTTSTKTITADNYDYHLGGKIYGVEAPIHYDFEQYRQTPHDLRTFFQQQSWSNIIAFHTDTILHRAEENYITHLVDELKANAIIQSTAKASDIENPYYYSRIRCHEHITKNSSDNITTLHILPNLDNADSLRTALLQAIINKNYGYTHSYIHNYNGHQSDFSNYHLALYAAELNINTTLINNEEIEKTTKTLCITNTEIEKLLSQNQPIPETFSYSEIINELRDIYRPTSQQGFTIFCTGLSGAGKSTIANALRAKLLEIDNRKITLLDGDIVRQHLSSELGFSKKDRDLNILRIGFVANEITKNGGIAICAPIAPYKATRNQVRKMIEANGKFIEIYVATPLTVCENRDRKGLYAKARSGVIEGFTGIDAPYEAPEKPELRIDTSDIDIHTAIKIITDQLITLGLVKENI